MNFWQEFFKLNWNEQNQIITVIDGPYSGKKALYTNGKLICATGEADFFKQLSAYSLENHLQGVISCGQTKVFVESIGTHPRLVICGGGHISIPIIKIGNLLDMEVTVIEDRPAFADQGRRAGAKHVICNDFSEALDTIEGDLNTFFVIVTRGHRYDTLCLEKILKKKRAYVGMIGSKVRVKMVREQMLETGFSEDDLAKLYSPIGLDIKAETPAEIAVSIMAEVIQVKNEKPNMAGYSKDILNYLSKTDHEQSAAFVTIIERKGSAPRGRGTKMIVTQEGQLIGTIGGGCAEANVRNLALQVIRSGVPVCTSVDMTGRDAEEDGMVCGGIIELFIETI